VRVIDADGEQLGIMEPKKAVEIASAKHMDLVEVSPKASPPVCRIMDYGKYKYQQKKRQQEAKKKQVIIKLKEIKFRPKTDSHDFDFKIRHIKKFIGDGDKVKVTIIFKGREIIHQDLGFDLITRIKQEVVQECQVEQEPKMEGRNMVMILGAKTSK